MISSVFFLIPLAAVTALRRMVLLRYTPARASVPLKAAMLRWYWNVSGGTGAMPGVPVQDNISF